MTESIHHCRRCGTMTNAPKMDAPAKHTDRVMIEGRVIHRVYPSPLKTFLVCRGCWESIVEAITRRVRT